MVLKFYQRIFCITPYSPLLMGIPRVDVQPGFYPWLYFSLGMTLHAYSLHFFVFCLQQAFWRGKILVNFRSYQIIVAKLNFDFRKFYFQVMLCKRWVAVERQGAVVDYRKRERGGWLKEMGCIRPLPALGFPPWRKTRGTGWVSFSVMCSSINAW